MTQTDSKPHQQTSCMEEDSCWDLHMYHIFLLYPRTNSKQGRVPAKTVTLTEITLQCNAPRVNV